MGAYVVFFGVFFLVSVCTDHALSKECTNSGSPISSHTVRAQLLSTDNGTRKADGPSHYHLTPTDESAWMSLLPRKLLSKENLRVEFEWAMLYRSMKSSHSTDVRQGGRQFLKEISLHDVRLDPTSIHGQAQQTNLEYLLMLDVDRLVWSFRKQAGLPAPGEPYGGWERPDSELRGHFVGHYLSASAQMWASTHNDTLHEKMSLVVDALNSCQIKIGTGYLSAFPSEFFDRFEATQPVWAPYYTIHKIMAGLLDQYTFASNGQALEMVTRMAECFGNRVKNVIRNFSIERHWLSLNEETGGMNDVLYKLYSVTGDRKHLILAHLFDKPCFLGLLAVQADSLSDFHANTHIPVVIGAQMRHEMTGDPIYMEIGKFFMDIVNSSHSYATGGTSVGEFWSNPKRLADTLETENEESCTTYNMLKVSRNLFRWTKEMAYADYYERALTNGVIGIQRGREPGTMIYMLPMGRGVSKAHSYHGWGTKFDSFWCCYGTGIESFSKLGDSIYFEEDGNKPGLYIIQFVPSSFNWKSGGLVLTQKIKDVSSWDPYLRVRLIISSNESICQSSTLNTRVPSWASLDGAKAALNSQNLHLPHPGNFLSVTRKWVSGDELSLQLPISLRTEPIKDDRPKFASVQAILFGPYLLAGLTNGDWSIRPVNLGSVSDWITAIPPPYHSQLISLAQTSSNKTFFLLNSNDALKMDKQPKTGTDYAVSATFRLIALETDSSDALSQKNNITGHSVMLEPFNLPGMVIAHQGPGNSLKISSAAGENSVFKVVPGLDGASSSVSLESMNQKRCFVHAGEIVKLICEGSSTSDHNSLRQAASFTVRNGIRQYNPISFVAKGARRNFILEPLMSLRDESYTVYFNITESQRLVYDL